MSTDSGPITTTKADLLQPKVDNFKRFLKSIIPASRLEDLQDYDDIGMDDIVRLVLLKLQPYLQHATGMREPAEAFASKCDIHNEDHIAKIARYFEFFTVIVMGP